MIVECSKLNRHVQMKVAERGMNDSDEDRLSHCHRNVHGFVDFESDLVDCTFAKLGMLFANALKRSCNQDVTHYKNT